MIGTFVNCIAIVVGGLLGLLLKKGIAKSFEISMNKALGIGVLIIGLNGVMTNMITVDGAALSSSGELLLIASLVIGVIIGEFLRIDDRLNGLSAILEKKFHLSGFANGFVAATILFCVGAMAIIGALNDGLTGDSTVLFVKSLLDGIAAVILGASMGVGVLFSAVPTFLYQGGVSLLAGVLSNVLVGELLTQVCMVGYAIIVCIGVNFLASTKIKTANFLPAMLIPVVYHYICRLVEWLV